MSGTLTSLYQLSARKKYNDLRYVCLLRVLKTVKNAKVGTGYIK